MKVAFFVLLSIFQILIGCTQRHQPRSIDFEAFTIHVPAGWYSIKQQGIDSYVGALTNGKDTLFFDYGWYSYDFRYENVETQLFTIDTINGKKATLTKPNIPGKGNIGMYIANAYRDNHFNLIGKNIVDEQTVFRIFKSVQFQDSDTTLNSIQFAEDFNLRSEPISGGSIFLDHCTQCHNLSTNYLVGPSITTMTKERFDKWFFDTTFVHIPEPPIENLGVEYHRTFLEKFSREELELVKELLKKNK